MDALPSDATTTRYAFEGEAYTSSHRDQEAAQTDLKVLWARLEGTAKQLKAVEDHDPDGHARLLRYVVDGPLNIAWYENRRPALKRKQKAYNIAVFVVVGAVFLLALLMPFLPLMFPAMKGDGRGMSDVAALIGLLSTAGVVALRVSSHVVRYRQQATVFHEASSLLKEQLYKFEDAWRGKPLVVDDNDTGTPRLDPEISRALQTAINDAQTIVANEQERFFGTLTVDVQAITDAAKTGASEMAAHTLSRKGSAASAQARAALSDEIATVTLARDTAQRKVALLQQEYDLATRDKDEPAIMELRLPLREQKLLLEEHSLRLAHLQAKAGLQ